LGGCGKVGKKNARISPRCHASTLASQATPPEEQLPLDVDNPSSVENSVKKAQAEPSKINQTTMTMVSSSPASPLSRFINETTASMSSPRVRSSTRRSNSTVGVKAQGSDYHLSSQQFLWDSIQFLSDPYVVGMLAGDDPETLELVEIRHTKSRHNSSNSNTSGKKPVVVGIKGNLERKASLRSCEGASSTNSTNKSQNTNGRISTQKQPNGRLNGATTTTNGRIPHNNNNNHIDKNNSRNNSRRSTKNLTNSTLSPVVMVSDIFRGKSTSTRDALLFVGEEVDRLPPLPPWPN
jgi:hypothetical protein